MHNLFIERMFILRLHGRLHNFKQKSADLYQLSCPICGDSVKDKRKARGYLFTSKDSFGYHCHNCGISISFTEFLKKIDLNLANDLRIERLRIKYGNAAQTQMEAPAAADLPVVVSRNVLAALPTIFSLSPTHSAKIYLQKRQLPSKFFNSIYYCADFRKFTNRLINDKFENEDIQEERIVFPLIDKTNTLVGYQGRLLHSTRSSDVRYITIMLDKTKPRLFGIDGVNFKRDYPITEGPIDSMFVENSLASCGSSITSEVMKNNIHTENAIVVYDNEPRNKETVAKMLEAISNNLRLVIWPETIHSKDINDMIVKEKVDVPMVISQNVYSGLQARAKLSQWKRI